MQSRSSKKSPPLKRGFRGGLKLPDDKGPANIKSSEFLVAAPYVSLPLTGSNGESLTLHAEVGERVLAGQLLAENPETGEKLYASATGIIGAETGVLDVGGNCLDAVTINCDSSGERYAVERPLDWRLMSPEDILALLKSLSLYDGARPLDELLSKALNAETLVVRAFDTEPPVSSSRRVAIDLCEDMLEGIHILMAALVHSRCYITVNEDDRELLHILNDALISEKRIQVLPISSKYPLDDRRILASRFSGYKLGSPMAERSAAVIGSYTAAATARAVVSGLPDIYRLITVAGDAVANPKNLLVPLGTPFSALIAACGGYLRTPRRLIAGGMLTGIAAEGDELCVTRSMTALLALTGDYSRTKDVCINCGRCADVCPAGLLPSYIYRFYSSDTQQRCAKLRIDECIVCGVCAYVCPSCLPLTQVIEELKNSTDLHAKD